MKYKTVYTKEKRTVEIEKTIYELTTKQRIKVSSNRGTVVGEYVYDQVIPDLIKTICKFAS